MNPMLKSLAIGIAFLGILGATSPPAVVADSQVEAALRVLQAKTAKAVVDFAESKRGTKVGGGESTELIAAALKAAGAEPGQTRAAPYVWGTPLERQKGETRVMPRAWYIIQMEGCVFKKPTAADAFDVMEFKRHTAVIKSVSGTSFVLLHQGLNPKKSAVVETTLDLAWLTAGDYRLYLPIPAPKETAKEPEPATKPGIYIVCSPIVGSEVNFAAGRRALRRSDDQLISFLKDHGFEVIVRQRPGEQTRRVFANLFKETKTPVRIPGTVDQVRTVVAQYQAAIAGLVYGGERAINNQVKREIHPR